MLLNLGDLICVCRLLCLCVVSFVVHTGLVVPVVQERRVWPQPSSLTMTLAWEGEQEGHFEASLGKWNLLPLWQLCLLRLWQLSLGQLTAGA